MAYGTGSIEDQQNEFTRRLSQRLGEGTLEESVYAVAAELGIDGNRAKEWLSYYAVRPAGWSVADEERGAVLHRAAPIYLEPKSVGERRLPLPAVGSALDQALEYLQTNASVVRWLVARARLYASLLGLENWPAWLTVRTYIELDWAYPIVDWSGAPELTLPPFGYPQEEGFRPLPLHPDMVFMDALQLLSAQDADEWWISDSARRWRDDPLGCNALTDWARAYIGGGRSKDAVDSLVLADFFRGYTVPEGLLRRVQGRLRPELRRLRREFERHQQGKPQLTNEEPGVRYLLALEKKGLVAIVARGETVVGEENAQVGADTPPVHARLELTTPPVVRGDSLNFRMDAGRRLIL